MSKAVEQLLKKRDESICVDMNASYLSDSRQYIEQVNAALTSKHD